MKFLRLDEHMRISPIHPANNFTLWPEQLSRLPKLLNWHRPWTTKPTSSALEQLLDLGLTSCERSPSPPATTICLPSKNASTAGLSRQTSPLPIRYTVSTVTWLNSKKRLRRCQRGLATTSKRPNLSRSLLWRRSSSSKRRSAEMSDAF